MIIVLVNADLFSPFTFMSETQEWLPVNDRKSYLTSVIPLRTRLRIRPLLLLLIKPSKYKLTRHPL